jgi:enoyl-CoA hydratase
LSEPEVLINVADRVGTIMLNRPRAINALNLGMVEQIASALTAWEGDGSIKAVVLIGAGERGLCAGGDIVNIHRDADSGSSGSIEFWRAEYALNAQIARFRKPYVAIMDGIVMGGGVGVSAHGNTRIVTERSRIGMPETGIGFVPDVGGTYLLSRAPGEIGTHLALTTATMTAADAIACGFADHYMPSEAIGEFVGAIAEIGLRHALNAYTEPAGNSPLLLARSWIDPAYSGATVAEIIGRLLTTDVDDAGAAAAAILAKSPTALAVTLESLRRARELHTLEEVLNKDFRVSSRALHARDLAEGIRAQVIDKDRNPQWDPAKIDDVSADEVQMFFEPLGESELGLQVRA